MGCPGCGKDKDKYTFYDRHGNVIDKEQVGDTRPLDEVVSYDGTPAAEKSIKELLEDKKKYKKYVEDQHKVLIDNSTDDMKRLMIMELISLYNHEELAMTRMSPTQALVALWKYLHDPRFQVVLKEFPGLIEEVDTKYTELKKNMIKSKWMYY